MADAPLLADTAKRSRSSTSQSIETPDDPDAKINLSTAFTHYERWSWGSILWGAGEQALLRDAMVIRFMEQRLAAAQVKMSSAQKGVHVQLCELCTLQRELDSVQHELPKVKITKAFLQGVKQIDTLGKLPKSSIIDRFWRLLQKTFHEDELELGKKTVLLKDISEWQYYSKEPKDQPNWFVKEIKKQCDVDDAEAALLQEKLDEHCMKKLKGLKDPNKFGQYPILDWVIEVVIAKVEVQDYLFFWMDFPEPESTVVHTSTQSFPELESPVVPMTTQAAEIELADMRWATIGEFVIECIEDGALAEKDATLFVGSGAMAFRKGIRRIHSEVMPKFQLKMVELESLITSNIENRKVSKARLLAGFITLGITAGQLLGKWYMMKDLELDRSPPSVIHV